jgi:hypothetical protein
MQHQWPTPFIGDPREQRLRFEGSMMPHQARFFAAAVS